MSEQTEVPTSNRFNRRIIANHRQIAFAAISVRQTACQTQLSMTHATQPAKSDAGDSTDRTQSLVESRVDSHSE